MKDKEIVERIKKRAASSLTIDSSSVCSALYAGIMNGYEDGFETFRYAFEGDLTIEDWADFFVVVVNEDLPWPTILEMAEDYDSDITSDVLLLASKRGGDPKRLVSDESTNKVTLEEYLRGLPGVQQKLLNFEGFPRYG